jgi:periplasmic protein TonB
VQRGLNWIEPHTSTGSVLTSLIAHGLLCWAVVAVMSTDLLQTERVLEDVTVDYEMLDEVPEQKTVTRAPRVKEVFIPQPKTAVSDTAKELQDEKSEVAGTQAAAKTEAVGSGGTGDAEAVPFYKIKPKYPKAALVTGDEGWILMKIDVTETGEVENIRVVDGEKRNLFQDEARRAVAKWKYKPFTDGSGNPVRKADHQVRVDFKLQDA